MNYSENMKIGFFDSGVGGYFVAIKIMELLPQYDYVYFADTLYMPYGSLASEQMYERVTKSLKYLFEKENCAVVVLVCNTASAVVLRKIQQEWLAENFPERRVLGMLVPTIEVSAGKIIGVLATQTTVNSGVYDRELRDRYPEAEILEVAMPGLAELVEKGNYDQANTLALSACKKLEAQNADIVILGCTHYSVLKDFLRANARKEIQIISQDEFIPLKFKDYLDRHPEIENHLSQDKSFSVVATGECAELEKISGHVATRVEL